MIEAIDNLADGFWTETELYKTAKNVINPVRADQTAKHLCWYHLFKDGVYTTKAILLAVESIVDGQTALNRLLTHVGLTAQIGDFGEVSVLNGVKVNMLYLVLDKYNYKGKLEFIGDDKVFTYENWMAKLV